MFYAWRNTVNNTARCWGPWRNWRCPGRTTAMAILEPSPPYRRQQARSECYESNVNSLKFSIPVIQIYPVQEQRLNPSSERFSEQWSLRDLESLGIKTAASIGGGGLEVGRPPKKVKNDFLRNKLNRTTLYQYLMDMGDGSKADRNGCRSVRPPRFCWNDATGQKIALSARLSTYVTNPSFEHRLNTTFQEKSGY